MIWIEIVCDGCNDNPWGESYRKGSLSRIKANAKANGWKPINGKIYCPECQTRVRAKNAESENKSCGDIINNAIDRYNIFTSRLQAIREGEDDLT